MSTLALLRDRQPESAPGFDSDNESYELVGPSGAPVVAVLGGISASRHVTSTAPDPRAGWWEDVVGEGRAIDTTRFRVISIDYRWHRPGEAPITTDDQAFALANALDRAGIDRLHAVIGASYGGMVALAFGAAFPQRAGRLIVISAAHESDPMSTALRHLQRRVVELGTAVGRERDALSIARGIAITSYLTPKYLEERLGDDDRSDSPSLEGRIGRYLQSTGERFANDWTAAKYNSLSLSLDLHRVKPEEIVAPTTVIAISSDRLVPLTQSRELASRLGGPSQLIELDSTLGHDAFLGDWPRVAPFIQELIDAGTGILS